MAGSDLFIIPLYALLIFAFIGLIGNWRTAITILLFSYAAVIVAAQYNNTIAEMDLVRSLSGREAYLARRAFAFVLSVPVAFFLLNAIFALFWGKTRGPGGTASVLGKLMQSLMTGLAGWAVAVVLTISLLTYRGEDMRLPPGGTEVAIYADAINSTAETVVTLVSPWLPDGPPSYLDER